METFLLCLKYDRSNIPFAVKSVALRAFALLSGRLACHSLTFQNMLVQILPFADKKGRLSFFGLSLHPTSGSNTFPKEKMWKLGAAIFSISIIFQTFANDIEMREKSRRENKRKWFLSFLFYF